MTCPKENIISQPKWSQFLSLYCKYVGMNLVFLIKISFFKKILCFHLAAHKAKTNGVEVLESYANLGPIHDFYTTDHDGQIQVVNARER